MGPPGKVSLRRWQLNKDLKAVRNGTTQIFAKKNVPGRVKANEKALRQKHGWCI